MKILSIILMLFVLVGCGSEGSDGGIITQDGPYATPKFTKFISIPSAGGEGVSETYELPDNLVCSCFPTITGQVTGVQLSGGFFDYSCVRNNRGAVNNITITYFWTLPEPATIKLSVCQ